MQRISRFILKVLGWQLEQQQPDKSRYVLIAYPHTSNWDFILGMLAMWAMNMPLNWVAKHSLFWWPLGILFKAMGGVPLNRNQSSGFIRANIELFQQRDEFVLGIMPEGTRAKTTRWKTGFYYIADGAEVPLVLGYLDYKNRKLGVGKVMHTSGDIDADFAIIKAFYKSIIGCCPENQSDLNISRN